MSVSHQDFAHAVEYYYEYFNGSQPHLEEYVQYHVSLAEIRVALAKLFYESPLESDMYYDTKIREMIIEECIQLVQNQKKRAIDSITDKINNYEDNYDPDDWAYEVLETYHKMNEDDLEHLVTNKVENFMNKPENAKLTWTDLIYKFESDDLYIKRIMIDHPIPPKQVLQPNMVKCQTKKKPADKDVICNPMTGNWIKVGGAAYKGLLKKYTAQQLQDFTDTQI